MGLALLTLGWLSARPAQAQYPGGGYPGGGYPGGGGGWVPSDSYGNPTQTPQQVNSDGSANLLPSGKPTKKTNTYPIPDSENDWWFSVFSPNSHPTSDPYYYYYNSLHLDSHAGNSILDTSRYGHAVGTYAPPPWDPGEWFSGQTQPPDLNGKVHADTGDDLMAYFVWTGDQSQIPDHQDFLLRTSLSATASVSYGTGGATSGVSATGMGMLEGDTVIANAGDAGDDHPAPHIKSVLVRAKPNGNLITLSRSAGVSVDTKNTLPFSPWSAGEAEGGTSYYSYMGDLNGQTDASASATVSAKASQDSRYADIRCKTIEESSYKDVNGNPMKALHIRTPSGAITTDSAVTWSDYGQCWSPLAIDPGYSSGAVPFDANALGFSSPTFSWTHSGEGTLLDDWENPGAPITEGVASGNLKRVELLFKSPTMDGFPKSTSISLTVTDGDGASATNTFGVKWHLPLEKRDMFSETYTKHSLKDRCTDIQPDFPAVMNPEPAQEFKFAPLLDGAALFVPEGAATKGMLELVAKIAEMFEFKYDYGGENANADKQGAQLNNDSTNYGDAVKEQNFIYQGTERNYPINLGPDPFNYWECKMTIKLMEHDHDRSWHADGYSINGFDGNENHVVSSHIVDSVFSERFFHRFRMRNGTPADDNTVGDSPPLN